MRTEFRRIGAVIAATVGGALAAQNAVVPGTMAGVEGGGGTNIPFGSNLSCRYQVVYDVEELSWSGPRVITGLALRPDANLGATTLPAKGFLDVSLLVSTTSRSSTTLSPTFADNYGTDATWVVANRLIQLPAQPPLAAGPTPVTIAFPFAVPWAYGLTPVTNGEPVENLLVEIWIHSQPSGSYRLDNLSGCIAPTAAFGNQGPLCTQPGGNGVSLTGDPTMLAGSSYSWHVAGAPANTVFLLALNLTVSDGLFGIPALPLPYPMFDPADPTQPSAALAPLVWPAPDCWVNVNPIVWLTGVCDGNGSGSATGLVPAGRDSIGEVYYAQAWVFAPTANPLRIVTSNGRETTVCGPLSVARNYAFYNPVASPPQPVPSAGSVQYGVGPVIEVW